MSLCWHKPSYPQRHHDELRAANRYAVRAVAFTGVPFGLLMLGTIFGPFPPIATAFAGTIFLLFGLLGGLGTLYQTYRYIRVIPYFQRSLGGIDTFLAGRTMVRFLTQLDFIAKDQNVQPLSTFGFPDDLRGERLQWHDPKEGLLAVDAILNGLARYEVPASVRKPLLADLAKWQHALQRAYSENVFFCILLRHGNSTSGHEWDVRKGSAF